MLVYLNSIQNSIGLNQQSLIGVVVDYSSLSIETESRPVQGVEQMLCEEQTDTYAS